MGGRAAIEENATARRRGETVRRWLRDDAIRQYSQREGKYVRITLSICYYVFPATRRHRDHIEILRHVTSPSRRKCHMYDLDTIHTTFFCRYRTGSFHTSRSSRLHCHRRGAGARGSTPYVTRQIPGLDGWTVRVTSRAVIRGAQISVLPRSDQSERWPRWGMGTAASERESKY